MCIVDNSMMLRGCKIHSIVSCRWTGVYSRDNPLYSITQVPIYFIYMHIYIHYFLLANIRITNHSACILTVFSWSSFWSWFCLFFFNFVYVLMMIFICVCLPFFILYVLLEVWKISRIFIFFLHQNTFWHVWIPNEYFQIKTHMKVCFLQLWSMSIVSCFIDIVNITILYRVMIVFAL